MSNGRPFVTWGPDHVTVLGLTVVAVGVVLCTGSRLSAVYDRPARRTLALLLAANELIAWVLSAAQGMVRIPLQLCDLALFATIWALWSLRPSVTVIAYFWVLAGGLQAILTPDLRQAFPSYWWVKFFLTHVGSLVSVVYLAATGRVGVSPRSVWHVWGWTNLYALGAGLINWQWGTNYGYLARKPMQPSILDWFGPWPFYLLGMEGLALVLFYLCYAPLAAQRKM